jgi:hypothetical protein
MKHAAIISFFIHFAVLLVLTMGIRSPFDTTIKDNRPMVIDFVQVADISAAPKLSPMNEKKEDKPILEKKAEDKTPDSPPEATVKEKALEKLEKLIPPENIKTPEKKEPEVKPDADPILKREDKKPKVVKKDPPKKDNKKPVSKKNQKIDEPKPNLKNNKQKDNKALVNLKKFKTGEKDAKKDPKSKPKATSVDDLLKKLSDEDGGSEQSAPAESIGPVVTANEIDAVRQTIRKCWTVPVGLQGIENMSVDIDMKLDPDGTVRTAHISDQARLNHDPNFRIAAESAKRAVLDPDCNRLPLPAKKYEQWKELTFTFNPKDMF